MPELNTPETVKSYMRQATSAADWNSRCDDVKRANGNDYPSFWFQEIILSGLHSSTQSTW